ncbi:hypothetical protein [Rubrivivax gelatinosus]|uniref:hypothetical protein n=2 Tax=Rubrivivax gelatinosus TaxID=28068 RepID=UPI000682EA2B|nr:hypothetical protein [Rubrivivax gelatinosus]
MDMKPTVPRGSRTPDLVAAAAHEQTATAPDDAPLPEAVTCLRCGHTNWIMEGKAPSQITKDALAAAAAAALPLEPRRDETGQWLHPALPWGSVPDRAACLPYIEAWGYEAIFSMMESEDDSEKMLERCEREGSFLFWTPKQPAGEGWFLGAIYAAEDGPVAVWLRPKGQALSRAVQPVAGLHSGAGVMRDDLQCASDAAQALPAAGYAAGLLPRQLREWAAALADVSETAPQLMRDAADALQRNAEVRPELKPLNADAEKPHAVYVAGYGYIDVRAVRAVERALGIVAPSEKGGAA